jgi:hypothetical protein
VRRKHGPSARHAARVPPATMWRNNCSAPRKHAARAEQWRRGGKAAVDEGARAGARRCTRARKAKWMRACMWQRARSTRTYMASCGEMHERGRRRDASEAGRHFVPLRRWQSGAQDGDPTAENVTGNDGGCYSSKHLITVRARRGVSAHVAARPH